MRKDKRHIKQKINKLRNELAKKIRLEIKKAKVRYHKEKRENLLSSSSKEWYRHINNIIGNKNNSINLTNIPELTNKTPEEQVAIVNAHFSNICQKYPALKQGKKLENSQMTKIFVESQSCKHIDI